MMGFLKKLPLFPKTLGSGSLLCLIDITALETSLIVGVLIPIFSSSVSIAPYFVFN